MVESEVVEPVTLETFGKRLNQGKSSLELGLELELKLDLELGLELVGPALVSTEPLGSA